MTINKTGLLKKIKSAQSWGLVKFKVPSPQRVINYLTCDSDYTYILYLRAKDMEKSPDLRLKIVCNNKSQTYEKPTQHISL